MKWLGTQLVAASSLHLFIMDETPFDIAMNTLRASGTDAVKCGHVCRQCGELIRSPPAKETKLVCRYCQGTKWLKLTAPEGGHACQECGNISHESPPDDGTQKLACESCGSSDWIKLPCAVIMVVGQ